MSFLIDFQIYLLDIRLEVFLADGWEIECVVSKIFLLRAAGMYGRGRPVLTSHKILWSPNLNVCHIRLGDDVWMSSISSHCCCAVSMSP